MKEENNVTVRTSVHKRRAGEVLSMHGNRLLLTQALLVCIVPVSLYGVFDYVFAALSLLVGENELGASLLGGAYALVCVLLTLFLTLPLWSGLLFLADAMVKGERAVLADLFRAFSSGREYRRALSLAWQLLWRVCLVLVLALAASFAIGAWNPESWLATFLYTFLGCLAAFLLFGSAVRHFLRPYLFVRCADLSERARADVARAHFYKGGKVGFFYWLSFLPWILLGLLTLGILLLVDVFPRMLLTYVLTCESAFWEEND